MKSRFQLGLAGILAVGALTLPLVTSATAAPKKAPAKKAPAKGGNVKAGLAAFKSEGCTGCHKTKDYPTAGEVGPDLSDTGKGHTVAQIAAYIVHPKAGSIMPASKAPKKVVDDMAAYLATQK